MKIRSALIGLMLLAGCSRAAPDLPPEIHLGQDECARCRMVVDQERYACARVGPEKAVEVFDDVGELFVHRREAPLSQESLWVHDYATATWLPARTAFYVQSSKLVTPMGFGVVAVASAEQAAALAAEQQGLVKTFEQMEKGDLKR